MLFLERSRFRIFGYWQETALLRRSRAEVEQKPQENLKANL